MKDWQLCVMSETGREVISFVDGRFTVGSSDSDDIRLERIDPQSLTWIFIDGVLTLMNARLPIYINGKSVPGFPLDVSSGHVISVGECHLVFGESGCDWPEPPDIAVDSEEEIEIEEVVQEEILAPAKIRVKDSLPLGIFAVLVALGTMALVFGSTSYLSNSQRFDPLAEQIELTYRKLHKLVAEDSDLSGVEVRQRMDGTLVLSGLAGSEAAYSQLMSETRLGGRDTDGYVLNTVVSAASLASELDGVLGFLPASFAIHINEEMKRLEISIFGIEKEEGELATIVDVLEYRLRTELTPWQLDLMEFYIPSAEFFNEVKDIIESNEVSRDFRPTLEGGKLIIEGRRAVSASIDKVMARLDDYAGKYVEIQSKIVAEREVDWNLISTFVSGDGDAYALLESSSGVVRVTKGVKLRGKQRVDRISDAGISITLEGYTYFIPVTVLDG